MKVCGIKGCKNKSRRLGLCEGHIWRMKRYGSPMMVKKTQYHGLTPEKRFFKYVKKTGSCWLWKGGLTPKGYGLFAMRPRNILAHRFSWMLHKGKIPGNGFVCHHCDNPICVNPDHLFLGDQMSNMKDMISKNRQFHVAPQGEDHGMHKLTEGQVLEIRKSKEYGINLASRYGVTATTISDIRKGRIWKHLL